MKNILLSVITPVYNTEKYLRKCIDSVLSQTYRNIKLYLIDDGSNDGSSQICDEYAQSDDRIVVIHKKNEGQAVARNVALDMIVDGYIGFVDSDDYIDPNMFKSMIAAMEEHGADISICGIQVQSLNKNYPLTTLDHLAVYDNNELIKEYISSANIFTGMCNKVFNSELFDGVRFPSLRANEDAYILHDILKKCNKAVHIGERYYVQYVREGSTEKSGFSEKNWALLEVAERLMACIRDDYPQYYQYVAAKKIEDAVNLMKKILISSSYSKVRSDYKKLRDILITDYRKVKETYPQSIKKEVKLAAENELGFRVYCFILKTKKYLVRLLRR